MVLMVRFNIIRILLFVKLIYKFRIFLIELGGFMGKIVINFFWKRKYRMVMNVDIIKRIMWVRGDFLWLLFCIKFCYRVRVI